MSQPAIRVDNLSKVYRVNRNGNGGGDLREALTSLVKAPLHRLRYGPAHGMHSEEFWALKDVSFEVQPGEILGVIGANGAGKSTLLKILSHITEPTNGRVEIRGRVACLLEVGTGFHPELSGRENVYLNGAILGMSKREIDRKFDEIVDFSGVENFLDTPVKRYSSGMRVRLGFAVAAHLDPEILIVDEVLAVGDAEFQKRCLGKMNDVARSGRTVLFVSHNMSAVQGLCTNAIQLQDGSLSFRGTAIDATTEYLRSMSHKSGQKDMGRARLDDRENTIDSGKLIISEARIYDEHGKLADAVPTSRPLRIEVDVSGYSEIPGTEIGVIIKNHLDQWLVNFNSFMSPANFETRSSKETVVLAVDELTITPGDYWIDLSIATAHTGRIDYVDRALRIRVLPHDVYGTGYSVKSGDGLMYLKGSWSIVPRIQTSIKQLGESLAPRT